MKYDQIDNALLFVDDDRTVVLQHEYMKDRNLIIEYIRDESSVKNRISRITDGMIELDRMENLKRVILVCVSDQVRMQVTENPEYYMSFFIERRSDRYNEGDTLDDKPKPTIPNTTTLAKTIRKHSEIQQSRYYGITIVNQPDDSTDDQTLVLQFQNESLRSVLQGIVRSYKNKNAESFIDQFYTVDVFVDLSLNPWHRTGNMRDKRWLRIVYERLDGNPEPGSRYPDATIIRVDRSLDKPAITLDMLLEGR